MLFMECSNLYMLVCKNIALEVVAFTLLNPLLPNDV